MQLFTISRLGGPSHKFLLILLKIPAGKANNPIPKSAINELNTFPM